MNIQRWIWASVAVTVVVTLLDTLIHGVMLSETYKQTASVWRPESEMKQIAPLMWLGNALFAPFFVWVYAQGVQKGKDLFGQGLRFGLMFGVGVSAMGALVWYVVLPIPQKLAFAWFVGGVAVYAVAGVAAALVYKTGNAKPAHSKKSGR